MKTRLLIAIALISVVIFGPYFLGSFGIQITGNHDPNDGPMALLIAFRWTIGALIFGLLFFVVILIIDRVVDLVEWITGKELPWGRGG